MNVGGDHVVIGAGGGTGSAVVHELVGRDLRVRAVTRSGKGNVPEGVEQIASNGHAAPDESSGTSLPAARLTASVVRPVRHHVR